MNSLNCLKFFGLIITILLCGGYITANNSTELEQVNWNPCKYENGTEMPIQSENVEIYVTNCTRNEEVCKLYRGTTPLLNITFTPQISSAIIERGIIAKMYMTALNRYVNIPYGSLWNPCETMRDLDSNETNCLLTGIESNRTYNSISEFRVNEDFPQVSDITVKILFRQKYNNRRISSLRKWDKHPGPLFICIEIPNCAVV